MIAALVVATVLGQAPAEHTVATDEVERARVTLTLCAIAAELRLREPQVQVLEPLVTDWLAQRQPTLAESMAADIVGEAIEEPRIHARLLPGQIERLERMRLPNDPKVVSRSAPGDDLSLARGRFPEDEYAFEALALAQFHGWPVESLDVLLAGGDRLGRAQRRTEGRRGRTGDPARFKPRCDPNESSTWRALVARQRATAETSEPDPGPYAKDPGVLIQARVALLLAVLHERIELTEQQREALTAPLTSFVEREHMGRPRPFGMVDRRALWNDLQLDPGHDPRRGGPARKELWDAAAQILNAKQRAALGLDR